MGARIPTRKRAPPSPSGSGEGSGRVVGGVTSSSGLPDSGGTARDRRGGAGHVGGIVREQEHDDRSDLLGVSVAASKAPRMPAPVTIASRRPGPPPRSCTASVTAPSSVTSRATPPSGGQRTEDDGSRRLGRRFKRRSARAVHRLAPSRIGSATTSASPSRCRHDRPSCSSGRPHDPAPADRRAARAASPTAQARRCRPLGAPPHLRAHPFLPTTPPGRDRGIAPPARGHPKSCRGGCSRGWRGGHAFPSNRARSTTWLDTNAADMAGRPRRLAVCAVRSGPHASVTVAPVRVLA
jgi:hypothetical protein